MGANAQTTVPTFTAGQVLTAAQMNNSARTGVPVFADTSARDAGFGGTGEKTLAEGQLCYLEDANVVQYYDGSSWATVGPQTLSSGLNYITGASFTSVTSVSLPDNTFTSTYRNYRIILEITAGSNTYAQLRGRTGGVDYSSGTYTFACMGLTSAPATQNTGSTTATGWRLSTTDNNRSMAAIDLLSPEVSGNTTYMANMYGGDPATTGNIVFVAAGIAGVTNQFDAATFVFPSACSGYYRVYGYADS
jgi:hypothetical protein